MEISWNTRGTDCIVPTISLNHVHKQSLLILHYGDAGGWLEQYRVLQEYLISRKQENLDGATIGGAYNQLNIFVPK